MNWGPNGEMILLVPRNTYSGSRSKIDKANHLQIYMGGKERNNLVNTIGGRRIGNAIPKGARSCNYCSLSLQNLDI